MRDVSQQIVRIAFPRGGMSQSINFSTRARRPHYSRAARDNRAGQCTARIGCIACSLRSSRRRDGENRRPALLGDELTIQLQHEPQNAVRSWMRRPMLSTIFSPISCCFGSRNAASAAATWVTGPVNRSRAS